MLKVQILLACTLAACSSAPTGTADSTTRRSEQVAKPAPAGPPDKELQREQLAARRAALRERLAAARIASANQAIVVEKLRVSLEKEIARQQAVEQLGRQIDESIERVRAAANFGPSARFSVIGEVVGVESDGRYYVRGAQVQTSGATFTQPLFNTAVLLDPKKGDLIITRMVQANDLHFRGYIQGVNGFGGPATAGVFSHAPPPRTKAQEKALREIQKLKALAARARDELVEANERIAPLTKARREQVEIDDKVVKIEIKLEVMDHEMADMPPLPTANSK